MLRSFVICFAVVTVGAAPVVCAGENHRPGLPFFGLPGEVIDFDCTSTRTRPPDEVDALASKEEGESGGMERRADRAFALDLNSDTVEEYLVPIACDDRGNCSWALFSIAPARLIGTIRGAVVYAPQSRMAPMMAGGEPGRAGDPQTIDPERSRSWAGPWPPLSTLARAEDGREMVIYYEFGRRGYREVPSESLTGAAARQFIERAGPPTCRPAKES